MDTSITAVVTCFNQEAFIGETLQSLLLQSQKELFILIINDGSTDNSLSILKKFSEEHSNIKIINTENKGVAAARNLGIANATTDLVFLMDGDDTIEPLYIEKLHEEFIADPETVLAIGQAKYIGDLQGNWDLPKFTMEKMLHGNIIFCGNLFRKKDWETAGYFDEKLKFREDWDFFIRLTSLRPHKVKQINYRGFNYRCMNSGRDATLQNRNLLQIANNDIYQKNLNLYFQFYDDPINLIKEIGKLKWEITKKERELNFLRRFIPNKFLLMIRNKKHR